MDPQYFPSPGRPPTTTVRLLGPTYAIGLSSLLLPPGPARSFITLPSVLWICYYARTHACENNAQSYLAAIQLCWFLVRWTDLVIMRNPEKELFRLKANDTYETDEEVAQMSLIQKMKRNISLFTTLRGVRWNWQVANIDSVDKDISPLHSAAQNCFAFSRCYARTDFVTHCLRKWSYHHSNMPDMFTLPLLDQILLGWGIAFRSAYDLGSSYYFCAAISVGLGLEKPHDYPPLFGKYSGCFTVRKVWGYGYHQYLRRIFLVSGSAIADWFGFRKGSLPSQYFKLYWAFFFSACLHHLGSMNVPYTDGVPYQFLFFIVQPLGITFEDIFIHLGKRLGLRESCKVKAAGFCWTICWFSFSLRYAVRAGYTFNNFQQRNPLVQLSISDYIFR